MELMLDKIDEGLARRVEQTVRTRLATTRAEARELVASIGQADDEVGGWAWLHATQASADDLLDECLRLVTGAAARTLGFEDGYCALADALVDELVASTPTQHWGSFTIMGRSEQYSRASRVIEVRAPATSIWELPTVAHELGHEVGPALVREAGRRTVHPLDALYDELGDGTAESWSWMQELFADVFAAYALGPAYGFACCLEVLDPLLSGVETDTHPPAGQRIGAIATTLRSSGSESDAWAAEQIEARWRRLVEAAGGDDGPGGDSVYTARLVALVNAHLPISRWDRWGIAQAEKAQFAGAPGIPAANGQGIADVLNGAWLARLGETSRTAIDELGRRAVDRIEQLVKGRG